MTTEELHQAIKELHEDLRRVDYAISSVEAVLAGKAPRGRPPKFVATADTGDRAQRSVRGRSKPAGAGEPGDAGALTDAEP